ncbi:MAG: helix-turn-helix domain-containing protein, partial [Alphaproteobacteria bacterium]|nr:helix-turn-helix domain-containing protein [Alphaproteobacteria bacterium]
MQGVLEMSEKERGLAHVIRLVAEKKLKQTEAAKRLGIGRRQVIRLVKLWRKTGDEGLVSK